MALWRRSTKQLFKAAERQQEEWMTVFGGDELRALAVLNAVADRASQQDGVASGDTGVIAIDAVRTFDRLGSSAQRMRQDLLNRYRSGSLKSISGKPIRTRVTDSALESIAVNALLNARPSHEAEIKTIVKPRPPRN